MRPGIARSHCAAYAARCSAPLYEGAPLSREAVAQQDVRAGSPAPGAASLSARQEVTEVEAPVYLAPCEAQQGAQEDRVLPQVAAVQVCDGLEGVDAAHLQGRTPNCEVVLQLSRRSTCGASHDLLPMYFSCMPAFRFIPVSLPGFPASNLASKAKEQSHGEDQAVSYG